MILNTHIDTDDLDEKQQKELITEVIKSLEITHTDNGILIYHNLFSEIEIKINLLELTDKTINLYECEDAETRRHFLEHFGATLKKCASRIEKNLNA